MPNQNISGVSCDIPGSMETVNTLVCRQVSGRRICALHLHMLHQDESATREELCKLLPSYIFGSVWKTELITT